MGWAPVYTRQTPYTSVCIPSVAMKGGTFSLAMTVPLTAPIRAQTASTPSSTSGMGRLPSEG